MKRLLKVTAAFLLMQAAAPAMAEIDEDLARQLFVESGAQQQLVDVGAQWPDTIRDALANQEQPVPFSPEDIESAARRAYDVALTEEVVIGEIRTQLDAKAAKDVLTWLRGRTGRRFTQLEVESSRQSAQAEIDKYAETLSAHPPPEKRLELIHSLDTALRITESATEMMMNMSIAIGIGMLEGKPFIDEDDIADMRDKVEEERPKMAARVGPAMFVMLLYSYRNVSDRDLERYIEFASSPAAARFQRAISEGLDRALTKSGMRLGQELSKLVPAREVDRKATS
jgi:hypothetical protein